MLRPGIIGMRGSMVIRLRPCMTSSTPLPTPARRINIVGTKGHAGHGPVAVCAPPSHIPIVGLTSKHIPTVRCGTIVGPARASLPSGAPLLLGARVAATHPQPGGCERRCREGITAVIRRPVPSRIPVAPISPQPGACGRRCQAGIPAIVP